MQKLIILSMAIISMLLLFSCNNQESIPKFQVGDCLYSTGDIDEFTKKPSYENHRLVKKVGSKSYRLIDLDFLHSYERGEKTVDFDHIHYSTKKIDNKVCQEKEKALIAKIEKDKLEEKLRKEKDSMPKDYAVGTCLEQIDDSEFEKKSKPSYEFITKVGKDHYLSIGAYGYKREGEKFYLNSKKLFKKVDTKLCNSVREEYNEALKRKKKQKERFAKNTCLESKNENVFKDTYFKAKLYRVIKSSLAKDSFFNRKVYVYQVYDYNDKKLYEKEHRKLIDLKKVNCPK